MSNERWRDTYDAWKLATPPEYGTEADERAAEEAEQQARAEARANLVEIISEVLADRNDIDVTFDKFAEAVVHALETDKEARGELLAMLGRRP